jgi:hypothetical protein
MTDTNGFIGMAEFVQETLITLQLNDYYKIIVIDTHKMIS